MKNIKLSISLLLLVGVLGVVTVPAINASPDKEFACGECQCRKPNFPEGQQYGIWRYTTESVLIEEEDESAKTCETCRDCYVELEQ